MKNRIYFIKIFFCIFAIIFPNLVLSNEFELNATELESLKKGDLIKGSGGIQIIDGLGLIITGENFEFDKINSVLKITEDVLIKDILTKDIIKSNYIILYKEKNIYISKDKTIIELASGHIIESSNITFDRNLNKIFTNEKTLIKDFDNNKITMNNFNLSTIDKVLRANIVKIKDNEGNTYNLENILYNIKTNEILGKDLSLNFNNTLLGSTANEPRLKSNTFFFKQDITQVNNGVFTTCKKNDSCPPWVLSSEKIEHNKTKKTMSYKNALLKVYDIPVAYFPKFFHPDHTVKRQSGFLIPQFSQSSNLGNYISTPYFFAISEAIDLTFSPRLYDDGKYIYQGEYRNYMENSEHIVDFSVKNKDTLSFDEENNSPTTHLFLKSKFDLDLNSFDEAKVDLKIQKTSNDEYLKTYKLQSPLIKSENILHSSIGLDINREDLEVEIIAESFENLSLINNDRYEYVYPSINILKNIKSFEDGNLTLKTTGMNKQFNTNVHEKTLVNDLNYKSYNKISLLGLVTNYEVLFKNFNANSKNSTKYTNEGDSSSLQSIVNYEMKYPLQKVGEKFLSKLTPTISARYSPNQSRNKSKDDRVMDVNNIFSLNRIGFSDTVEGGQSITIGNEYSIFNNKNDNKKILSVNLATSIRDVENKNLPINSTLGKKNSDIFGSVEFNTNKFIDFDYNFSLDNDLHTLNSNQIKSSLSFYNFVSTFDFLEKNNEIGSNSYISNETKLTVNESSTFGFKTRKNKETDLTEYYNLIYEYRNDCLVAGLEYKKDYYSDGSLKPDEQIFFSITIMPFGKVNTPDIKQ